MLPTTVTHLLTLSLASRSGNIRARKVRLLNPVPQERFDGVVCSMKDTFGFIERSDVVKEIFFHYSEYQGAIEELLLGDDVDFCVQTRNVITALCLMVMCSLLNHCRLIIIIIIM